MNIVVVSDFAHVNGGNAAVALGSAVGLAARGHAVTLFAGAGPVDERILASSIAVICTDQYSIADLYFHQRRFIKRCIALDCHSGIRFISAIGFRQSCSDYQYREHAGQTSAKHR